MLCGICIHRRQTPLHLFIKLVAVGARWGLANEFQGWLTFHPPGFFVSKQKVVCRMEWSLRPTAPILILKLNGRRLVPQFQHIIIMFDLQQKSEFDFVAFCLNADYRKVWPQATERLAILENRPVGPYENQNRLG